MAGTINVGASAIVMDSKDHVATAIKDLKAGDTILFLRGQQQVDLTLIDDIPFGHKLAIEDISIGTSIRKYGEVIGRTTHAITAGQHIHVHNVEGIRGRGDQVKEDFK